MISTIITTVTDGEETSTSYLKLKAYSAEELSANFEPHNFGDSWTKIFVINEDKHIMTLHTMASSDSHAVIMLNYIDGQADAESIEDNAYITVEGSEPVIINTDG